MVTKLHTYDSKATKSYFKTNRGNSDRGDIAITKNIKRNYDEPYNTIECVTESKILGPITNADNNLNEAVDDRLKKQTLLGVK